MARAAWVLLALLAVPGVAGAIPVPSYPTGSLAAGRETTVFQGTTLAVGVAWSNTVVSIANFSATNTSAGYTLTNRTYLVSVDVDLEFSGAMTGVGDVELRLDNATTLCTFRVNHDTAVLGSKVVGYTQLPFRCDAGNLTAANHTLQLRFSVVSGTPNTVGVVNVGARVVQLNFEAVPMTFNLTTAFDPWIPAALAVLMLFAALRTQHYVTAILVALAAAGSVVTPWPFPPLAFGVIAVTVGLWADQFVDKRKFQRFFQNNPDNN